MATLDHEIVIQVHGWDKLLARRVLAAVSRVAP
jgi:hypothetical protein